MVPLGRSVGSVDWSGVDRHASQERFWITRVIREHADHPVGAYSLRAGATVARTMAARGARVLPVW